MYFYSNKELKHRFTVSVPFLILDGFFHKTEKVPVNPHKQKQERRRLSKLLQYLIYFELTATLKHTQQLLS